MKNINLNINLNIRLANHTAITSKINLSKNVYSPIKVYFRIERVISSEVWSAVHFPVVLDIADKIDEKR